MKKIARIISSVALLVCSIVLTACGEAHTHTYSQEWSKDATYHWREATCEHSAEVMNKSEHNWDDGKTVKEATATETGEKKYTCLTCEYSKTETIPIIVSYTVNFYNGDTLLKTEVVEHGKNATPPEEVEKEGYRFDKWSVSYENVTSNLDCVAQFVQQFSIQFVDYDGRTISLELVDIGTSGEWPEDPERWGYTFIGWDCNDISNVMEDLQIVARYARNYVVTFKGFNGVEIDKQTVKEGDSAVEPTVPILKGYKFQAWDGDFSNVTSDITIWAEYVYETYNVKFKDYFGNVISEQTVQYYEDAQEPDITKLLVDWEDKKVKSFVQWDSGLEKITSNLTISAVYEDSTKPTMVIKSQQGATSNTENVEVYIFNVTSMAGISFSLVYDEEDLTLDGYESQLTKSWGQDKVLLQAYRKETPILDGEHVSIQIETGCKLNAATDVPETKNFLVMSAVFTVKGGAMASGSFPLKLIVSHNSLLDENYKALEFDVIETSIER